MTKYVRFLLTLICLMALFQVCPAPDVSADKDSDKDKPHSAEKEKPKSDKNKPDKDKLKPDKPKPKPNKPKPDKDKPPPPKTEEKGKLSDFSKPYKENADKKSKSSKSETSYDNNDWDDDDGGDFWDEFWADLFSDVFSALILGDFGYRYSSYPYNPPQQPLPGIYVSTNNDTLGDMTAFQFRTYYNTVDKNIKSYGLYSKLLLPSSWTWDMENNHYLEKVNNNMVSMNYFTTHFNTIGLTPDTNFVTDYSVREELYKYRWFINYNFVLDVPVAIGV